jgi:predicted secreted protein
VLVLALVMASGVAVLVVVLALEARHQATEKNFAQQLVCSAPSSYKTMAVLGVAPGSTIFLLHAILPSS